MRHHRTLISVLLALPLDAAAVRECCAITLSVSASFLDRHIGAERAKSVEHRYRIVLLRRSLLALNALLQFDVAQKQYW